MLLAMKTVAAEEAEVPMADVAEEDAQKEVDEVKEYTTKKFMEDSAAHVKM